MSLNFPISKTIAQLEIEIASKASDFQPYSDILEEVRRDISGDLRHNMPIAYFTPTRKVIYANKKLSDILGYASLDIIGKDVEEFICRDEELYPDWNKALIPMLSGNNLDIVRGKHIIKTSNASFIFFDLIYLAYRNKAGKLKFIKGIFQDITANVVATEKLVVEKEKIENILKCGSLGYWVFNTASSDITLSGNYEAITEYKSNEMGSLITFFKDNIHPNDWQNQYILTKETTLNEESAGVEFRFKTKSGKYKWILSKIINVNTNKVTNHKVISGIFLDIDSSKRAALKIREKERQIIRNEESLRKIYMAMPIGIIIYNSDGDYVESNDELLRIFGYNSKKEIDKINLLSFGSHMRTLMHNYEYSIDIGYDMQEKRVYSNYMNAPKTQHTKYLNIKIVSFLDSEGYINLDNDKLDEVLNPNEQHKTEAGFLLVATDTTILRKAELDLRTNTIELKEKNIILSKATEKAQESDRLKSAFLANVSHEIRTPLNAIIGFSELIATSEEKKEKDLYFDIVKTNNDLLLTLINDILDLSKIESGRIALKYESINIDNICSNLAKNAKAKDGVNIIFKLPDNIESKRENGICFIRQTLFISDKKRITQIYTNLINNAISNTNSGTIAISYNLVEIDENNDILRSISITEAEKIKEVLSHTKNSQKNSSNKRIMMACSVSDTGIGIPETKLEAIFHRFTKLNDNQVGFGLGLAITKSLVEQMNGSVLVKSQVNLGSEFTVLLPYNAPEGEPVYCNMDMDVNLENVLQNDEDNIFATPEFRNPNFNNKLLIENFEKINITLSNDNIAENNMEEKMLDILVAEDIDFNYMLVKAIIGKRHNLFRAKTGLEAVELFGKQKFNLILMDMKMPEMDGITATRLIREKDAQIPIIAVTAYAFDTDKQIALDAGCNTYIVKPIDPKILIAEIERYA